MMQEETYFNPFPGLRSFEEEEEYLFFGREKQIDELINKLSKTRFLAVVGASGSGKSSLVKSGLLPSLHSGYLAGAGSGWRICTFRPGNDPIGNLSQALCSPEILGENEDNETTPTGIESILRRNDQGVGETIKQLSSDHKQNVLIVVDQFEELFRFSKYEKAEHKGTRDSVSFINLLLAASKFSGIPIYVVFTMRSDFLGDCTEFRGLPEAINEGQYLIPRMTREERKAAITGPIAVGGATISQALLTRLLNDVGDNPDQLPILQHALMRTWEYWHNKSTADDAIDLVHYEAIGTMSKALSLHAEEAYFDLGNDRDKEVCKKLFKSLTEKRDDGRGIRRPSIIKEICELAEANLAEVSRIINIFRLPGRSFLMPPTGIELTEETVIDISHESLMRVWERLITWVHEEIESAELYTRLAKAAALYQEGKTGLWRDPELLMAINWKVNQNPNPVWAKRYDPSFERAINFLDYSQSEKDRELQGAERKRKAAIIRLRIFISIITGAFCLAVYFGVSSHQSEKKAIVSEKNAMIKKQQADSLKIIADKERDNVAIERDIASRAKDTAEHSFIFADHQKKIAEDAFIRAKQSLNIATLATKRAEDSALSASIQRKEAVMNATIAKAEKEKAVNSKTEVDRLRMLAEAKNIALKSGQLINDTDKDTLSLQLSFLSYAVNRKLNGPQQNRIIYDALKGQLNRYYNKTIRSRKDLKYEAGGYDLRALTFINATEFVTAGDGGVLKKCRVSGSPLEITTIATSKKFPENFSSIVLTPDAKFVIAGTTTGSIVLWDAAKPASVLPVIFKGTGKSNFIYTIPSTDNNYRMVAVFDNTLYVLLIDKSSLKVVKETNMGSSTLTALKAGACYTLNDVTHVFVSQGKTVCELTIDIKGNFSSLKKITDLPEPIAAIAVTKDGEFISAGGTSGSIIVYNHSGDDYFFKQQVRGHLSSITALNFSSNDSLLISGSLDHSIHVSKLFKTKEEEDLVFKEKDAWIRGLTFSPDNHYVLSVGQSGLMQVWPASTDVILKELQDIKSYKSYLDAPVNETHLKEELGDELVKSLWEWDAKNKNMSDLWKSLQTRYLNE